MDKLKGKIDQKDIFILCIWPQCNVQEGNVFLITSLLLLIIWYEQYGTNHNRTLINQFVTSTCWSGVAYNLLAQVPEAGLGVLGPFHPNFCLFH
jgi:hypothetical protein